MGKVPCRCRSLFSAKDKWEMHSSLTLMSRSSWKIFFDEGVLEGGAGSVGGAEGGDGIVVEKQRCKILDFWTWDWLWEPSGPFADVSRIGTVSCTSHGQERERAHHVDSLPREVLTPRE